MAKVKIYVSHRIDLDSVLVKNDIYEPIRCGAVFDTDYSGEIVGDNLGDNISYARNYLGEFTVQYWAYKNQTADYYGLCHYRRYLSWADKKYAVDDKNQVIENMLTQQTIKKYGLDNTQKIEQLVSKYDVIVSEYADITKMWTPRGNRSSVYEHFKAYDGYLINADDIDLFLETVIKLYPEIGKYTKEYFDGKKFRGYNCFILKSQYFNELCEIEISVLKEIHKSGRIDFSMRTSLQERTYGFFCEWLYGSYIYYLEKTQKIKEKSLQLVFFDNTDKIKYLTVEPQGIPIVFLTSATLFPVTQTAVKSLLESKFSNTKYDITFCYDGEIPCEQQKILQVLSAEYNVTINCINIKKYILPASTGVQWDAKTIAKSIVLLPWIFTKYEKIIFLHSDTIVQTDLSKLYEIPFENKLMLVTKDLYRIAENNKDKKIYYKRLYKLCMDDPYKYFSTSVMCMNLIDIRSNICYDYCLRHVLGSLNFQDILNKIYYDSVKFLPIQWNVIKPMLGLNELENFMPKSLLQELKEARQTPLIMHYYGWPKPWQDPRRDSSEFWAVARTTVSYEFLLQCMMGNYMSSKFVDTVLIGEKSIRHNKRLMNIANKLFPKGTRRREKVKKFYYKIKRKK